ncbi:alkaline phosphatase D family protein [Candidatus Magnetaquicoccus inordinatus]|uniref:alkaline phosphatase D family protein n=1 Tax=Candidatus Magnetaquicoccus inordinatus TaxID=2496818 RepID=UPI00102C0B9F|nr:alkaline phosphatase D family protein [Candidatus Magnetaquicoccus inordinatus]
MQRQKLLLSRREVLQWLLLLSVEMHSPLRLQAAEPLNALQRSPFGLGVASGSPSPDGFVLWTRLLSDEIAPEQTVSVAWQVFAADDPHRVVAQGAALALPELAHAVHVEVSGLQADCWYHYHFYVGGHYSSRGRTRTLPHTESLPTKLRFAYASCQNWENGFFAAYRAMQQEGLDLLLFVGDYIYEYAGAKEVNQRNVRAHALPVARTLADFRQRYALYKSDPLLQAMHAHCPWLVVWDDHEVQNDYAGLHSIYGTESFPALRAAAYQAYYEHMPLRLRTLQNALRGLQQGAELRLYDRLSFGRLAQFHLLDCRQYRDPPLCPEDSAVSGNSGCSSPHPSRSMLGRAQEQWLEEGLQASASVPFLWNIIVTQSRFTPGNYQEGYGVMASRDRWDGYPEARQRLLDLLLHYRPRNPLLVGGDIHYHWLANVHHNPYDVRSPIVASECIGTSITSRSGRNQEATNRHAAQNPHCLLSYSEKRGYGVIEIIPTRAEITLRVLEDVRDEDSPVSTLARFEIVDGRSLQAIP